MAGLTHELEYNNMRNNIIVGNWKMNLNRHNGIILVENVLKMIFYNLYLIIILYLYLKMIFLDENELKIQFL